MAETAAPDKLLFQLGVSAEGKLRWSSVLSPGDLCLALQRVQLELTTGQVKQAASTIAPGTPEDLSMLNGLKKRMGLR